MAKARPTSRAKCRNCVQLDEGELCAECRAVKGELAYDAYKESH